MPDNRWHSARQSMAYCQWIDIRWFHFFYAILLPPGKRRRSCLITQVTSHIFRHICQISLIATCLSVSVSVCVSVCYNRSHKSYLSENHNCKYLPLKSVIAKIVLGDLDLLFEGHKFKIVISLKRSELAKNVWDFCRFWHCRRTKSLRNYTPWPWPTFWRPEI